MTEYRPDDQRFEEPVARSTDPETSHMAAEDATVTASRGRYLAARTLLVAGPCTDFDLADLTGLQQNSIGKRRLDLQRAGMVEPLRNRAGEPIRRASPTGSRAQVWTLTTKGRRIAREWNLEKEGLR